MKTKKALTLMAVLLVLGTMPALAQRSGSGGGSRGGSSSSASHSSSSSSRGGGSYSSSSHSSSSSSRSSSSYSAPSRSSSSSRISSSYSAPSRSSSPSSRSSSSYSAPSRSSSHATRSSSSYSAPSRSNSHATRSGADRPAPAVSGVRRAGTTGAPSHSRVAAPSPRSAAAGNPRRAGSPQPREYARPGRPGGYLPPAARPIHPAPYFHHPWHGHMVHCHPVFWEPLPPRAWYWPGFWHYCNTYWYDYHVTDVVVVHDYVQKTYNVDMVTYGISGDIMYAIVRDGGNTYLQVYDKEDHLLAEQKINRKYCNMVIDAENGGCWISKKNEKDPLLFIWADGKLLIYEED